MPRECGGDRGFAPFDVVVKQYAPRHRFDTHFAAVTVDAADKLTRHNANIITLTNLDLPVAQRQNCISGT